ncbi:MAG TPA: helicase HerA-like domain-containing protein [Spirochaetota bacterium]|nr:helicase HerA-like domain-containing protein [Spirochaetota bacterium]
MSDNKILMGQGKAKAFLEPSMANRHGLITGATGTGKTVTLQMMAEVFSEIGVPVFVADIKGDIAGLSQAGKTHEKIEERVKMMGMVDFAYRANPVELWDLYRKKGLPMRATASDMGPDLWSRLLELSEAQSTTMSLLFEMADDAGLLLLDMKDLKAALQHLADNADSISAEYGQISKQTVQTIQRKLLPLEQQGGEVFFGEPDLDINDLIKHDGKGRGVINIISAEELVLHPVLYSTFLLWLLSELFEELPERGDADKPLLVFFFDEAHLLFNDAPKALVKKIEQVVRLIRSKGVGVYFVTQSPLDIPEEVLGQLGNRVQHALRAFTPKDQRAVRSAAETFRANPDIDTGKAITELGVGEALASFLDPKGVPGMVERVFVRPPGCRLGVITDEERKDLLKSSKLRGKYEKDIDRESAYEILAKKAEKRVKTEEPEEDGEAGGVGKKPAAAKGRGRQTVAESFTKGMARSIGSTLGRQIAGKAGARLVRGILGSILR